MRKKLYSQSYFLINFNEAYGHSLGIRIKYIGLNVMLSGYFATRYFFNVHRLPVFNPNQIPRPHKMSISNDLSIHANQIIHS